MAIAELKSGGLLRICTAGSVDDGKSTLIGRLLYDSRSVYEDQVQSIEKASKNRDAGPIDFSLFTDGLKAEREQGITIDVAYRYFATARRKFILADTPGHEQYTRNMATGASTADLAVILHEDAKNSLRSVIEEAGILADSGPDAAREVLLIVGPEGGMAPREVTRLSDAGAVTALLGHHVLRSSTAGPAAVVLLSDILGRWR